MTAILGNQRMGKGGDPGVTMGPLIHRQAVERVTALVEDAIHNGASLVYGGQTPVSSLGECFYPPTLLDKVTPDMRIAKEEVFGPVVSVLTFDDEEEALKLANDTPYG